MNIKYYLIQSVLLMAIANIASADTTNNPDPYTSGFGFERPNEAAWGGWTRGDTGTIYAEWDTFSDASYGTAKDRTAAPDVLGFSGVSSSFLSWNAGTFIAGSGNLYGFSIDETFAIDLAANSTATGSVKAALQIETWGQALEVSKLLLNGMAPSSVSKTYLNTAYLSSFGEVNLEQWLVLWELPEASRNYHFDFGAMVSTSLAQVAVDISAAKTNPDNSSGNPGTGGNPEPEQTLTPETTAPVLTPSIDLSLAMKAPRTVKKDKKFSYTFTVKNKNKAKSKLQATNVKLTVPLPDNLMLVTAPKTCVKNVRPLICNLGKINSSKSKTLIMVTKAFNSGVLTTGAGVNMDQGDLNFDNNTATVVLTVK